MDSILLYLCLVLLLACGVFAFLWQRAKSTIERMLKEAETKARSIEKNATEKLVEGLENENEVTGSTADGSFLD